MHMHMCRPRSGSCGNVVIRLRGRLNVGLAKETRQMVVPGQRSCVTLAPRAHQLLYANYSQNLCTCADDPLERIEVRRRSVPDALGLVLWLAHRPLLQRAAEARTAHVEKCTLRMSGNGDD